ncbi:MAG: right-handed parallel beta-helix repeat-containing protein [Nannocystaceae bacterium]|nr:right-handed parallel beta-helix repeat-containing protein [bacterium]
MEYRALRSCAWLCGVLSTVGCGDDSGEPSLESSTGAIEGSSGGSETDPASTSTAGTSTAGTSTTADGSTTSGGVDASGESGEDPQVTVCDDAYPDGVILASSMGPGYDPDNASAAFIAALTSAAAGDTVVVDFVEGSDGVWNIEEMYPSWFDGNSGEHQVADDVTVIFERGVTLRALSNTYDDPSGLGMLLRLEDVSGWRIFGYGARFEYSQEGLADGEFRHNIGLYDCTDIHIEGLVIDGSGGDGVLVSTRTPTGYSQDISVKNLRSRNNRRQGITLVSVEGFVSEHASYNDTSYRPPNSGIDFEPNYDTQRLTGIRFRETELAGNDYTGILFAFSHQSGSSVDFDITLEDTYIHDNWQAEGDDVNGYSRAAIVMGNAGGSTEASTTGGHITFERLYIKDEEYSGFFTTKHGHSFQANFHDWVIENVGNNDFGDDRYPIFTNRYDYGSQAPPVGRLAIDGLLVVEDRDVPFYRLTGSSSDGWSIEDLTIEDARIVTPYTGEGVDNVQGRPEGPGTSLDFVQEATLPATTVSVSALDGAIARGSSTAFRVTRDAADVDFPLPVEYAITGTADNFDDFDGLHGFAIIPAGDTTADVPVVARDKCDPLEEVVLTLVDTDNYALGEEAEASVTLFEASPR